MNELERELDNRRIILDAISEYPGIHLREIAKEACLAHNLVDYHLAYLEKQGFVQSHHDGKFKRYFLVDSSEETGKGSIFSAPDSRIVIMLRHKVQFQLILLILKNGPMTHKAIVEAMRRSPSTISHHLSRLMKAGLLSKEGEGSSYDISDRIRVERVLLRFKPQPVTLTDGFLEIWDDITL